MKEKQAEKWSSRILDFMAQDAYRPLKQHELAKALGASDKQRSKLRTALKLLLQDGKIEKQRQNRYSLAQQRKLLEGTISIHAKGFGFVTVDDPDMDDIFIPPSMIGGARSRDRVRIQFRASRKAAGHRGRRAPSSDPSNLLEGEVVEVLERGFSEVAGILKKRGTSWALYPNDPRFPERIEVTGSDRGLQLKAGFLGVVRLEEDLQDDFDDSIQGILIETGDRAGSPGADMWMLIRNFGLPLSFPKEVEEEAKNIPAEYSKEQLDGRKDVRDQFTLTIDPVTARDFDDALSLVQHKNGFTLSVHIADVAAFVKTDSAIEKEAVKRAFSVYLPDRVIPMLPERLTTDLCSLVPGQDRLAHTVEIDLGPTGALKGHRSYRSIIHSDVRLTYEQAQEIIDGDAPGNGDKKEVALVHKLYRLSQQIRKRRMQNGALDITAPERKCLYDDEGRITGIEIRSPLPAYQLVEECMLLANQAVALDLHKEYEAAIYRVHEPPNETQWDKMANDLSDIGVEAAPACREDISELLAHVQPESLRSVALVTVLKNIKRAEYRPEVGEHFGLAFTHYSHFTSPIRRYPDLVAHRLLNALERGKKRPFTVNQLAAWSQSSSARERAAEEAERAAIHLKCLQYFDQELKAGRTGPHEGIISGISAAGLTIELSEFLQRCFAPFTQPQDGEFFSFKSRSGTAENASGKKRLRVGDRVVAEVSSVSLEERRMEVVLTRTFGKPASDSSKPTRNRKGGHKKGKTAKSKGKRKKR